MTEQEEAPRGGCIATGIKMFAGLCGMVTVASIVNVAFDLDLALEFSGQETALPTDWMAVIALAIVSLLAYGIGWLMTSSWVGSKFKTYPWLKWLTPVLITLLLSIGFYAAYYNIEYAGPMHYASRANDIEAVEEELQGDFDEYDFDRSVRECITLDHVEILELLLNHPHGQETLDENIVFSLEMGSKDVIITFIDAGVGNEGEYGEFLAEFLAVSDLSNNEKIEVGLRFLENGADPKGVYTGGYMGTDLTAIEQAEEQGLLKLVKAMEKQ